MLATRLQKILSTRGIVLPRIPDGPMSVVCGPDGVEQIERWDESALGPRPTQAEIDAVDIVAVQAEFDADEAAKRTRSEKLHALAEWLRTQSKDVREKFQDLQSELAATQTAFQTFKTQSLAFKKKIEDWAVTKGGYTP